MLVSTPIADAAYPYQLPLPTNYFAEKFDPMGVLNSRMKDNSLLSGSCCDFALKRNSASQQLDVLVGR